MRFPIPCIAALAAALCWASPGLAQVLTKAIDIRSLPVAEAEKGRDVRIRGVVVFVESPSAIFVQDETSTTFFRTRRTALPIIGDEIEVTGRTRMGLYLPGIDYAEFRVLGRRALPAGIPARYDDLVFSRYHYQRVSLEGIVRSVAAIDTKKSLIRLAVGSRVIEARVEKPPQENRSLVDHRVRITGLAAGFLNRPRRQLVQPYVRVLDWSEVDVLAPAPPVTDIPHVSAEELLAFHVAGHGERRVYIEGTVTAVFPGNVVYLRQDEMGFAVGLAQAELPAVGDRVEVVGFPQMAGFSASVVDAELVKRTPGAAPEPLQVGEIGRLDEAHDGRLVRVFGPVRDAFKSEDGVAMLLGGARRTLQVRLPEGLEAPAVGTVIDVTGIYQVESATGVAEYTSTPRLVSLRLRSDGDLSVRHPPPWWNARRLATGVAVLAGLIAVAGLWIAVLRRQVRRQTQALRQRIETEAALEERQRIAREFHDTLEQELAGVSLRLDALATRELDEKARGLVAASRNLVTRIQTETRDLIGDLRDATEIAGDLRTALEAVAARLTADTGVDVQVEPGETIAALPPPTVRDLRMMAREAATNAINHGRASHVRLQLAGGEERIVLRVVDNGCGFDASTAAHQRRGHFGCAGMRERGRKIGATVTWESELQKGTTVEIVLEREGTGTPWPATPPRRDDSATREAAASVQ